MRASDPTRGLYVEPDPPEAPAIRKPNPPSKADAAVQRAQQARGDTTVADLLRKLAAIAEQELAATPPPPPSSVPRPPPPPPQPRLQFNPQKGAPEVTCVLTKAEFGDGPSEYVLRQGRVLRDRIEAKTQQAEPKDWLRYP
jgi:hypothetical protein